MIESQYWKEELRRIAVSVEPLGTPPRWTERRHCVVERDLMIGFFLLRRLIELKKVSSVTRNRNLRVFSCKARGKPVTRLSTNDLYGVYEMEKEVAVVQKAQQISNQFVHAYLSYVARDENRNWSDIYLISDFDRNKNIWRVPISEIRELFLLASNDYPKQLRYEFNIARNDYDIDTD